MTERTEPPSSEADASRPRATDASDSDGTPPEPAERLPCIRLHLLVGWSTLTLFLALGLVLEALHAFKVGWYLDPPHEARRLMWTLAHAHGTLLGLVHLAFAATVHLAGNWKPTRRTLASRCLLAAGILLPAGFFVAGINLHSADPNLGILLVPPGGILLLIAAGLTTQGIMSTTRLRPHPRAS